MIYGITGIALIAICFAIFCKSKKTMIISISIFSSMISIILFLNRGEFIASLSIILTLVFFYFFFYKNNKKESLRETVTKTKFLLPLFVVFLLVFTVMLFSIKLAPTKFSSERNSPDMQKLGYNGGINPVFSRIFTVGTNIENASKGTYIILLLLLLFLPSIIKIREEGDEK